MRFVLPTFTALAALVAVPAAAQSFGSGAPPSSFQSFSNDRHHGGWTTRDDRHRDRHRRSDTVAVMETYGGEWALYNNQSWRSDSFNDWWHDRPDRAFPRWVQHNQDCQRIWWSGGGWRC